MKSAWNSCSCHYCGYSCSCSLGLLKLKKIALAARYSAGFFVKKSWTFEFVFGKEFFRRLPQPFAEKRRACFAFSSFLLQRHSKCWRRRQRQRTAKRQQDRQLSWLQRHQAPAANNTAKSAKLVADTADVLLAAMLRFCDSAVLRYCGATIVGSAIEKNLYPVRILIIMITLAVTKFALRLLYSFMRSNRCWIYQC